MYGRAMLNGTGKLRPRMNRHDLALRRIGVRAYVQRMVVWNT